MYRKLGFFVFMIGLFLFSLLAGSEPMSAFMEKDDLSAFSGRNGFTVYYFGGKGCPYCAKVEPFLAEMKNKYPIQLRQYDIYSNRSCLPLFEEYSSRYGVPLGERGIPTVFVSDTYLVGDSPILDGLEEVVKKVLKESSSPDRGLEVRGVGSADQKDVSVVSNVPILSVTVAALADAISPCSIAILVFLIGARVLVANPRKRALKVGLSFCLSVFIAYSLFGLGLLTVVQASGFSGAFSLLVGLVALLAGIFYLKDVFWYGGGGFVMEVPRSLKPLLMKMLKGVTSPFGAFAMGFVVVCFEVPCTGGPYLFILGQLANSATRLQAIPLLLYYSFIFVLPLITISLLLYSNLFSISTVRKWNEKNKRLLRLVGGCAMMALGFLVVPISPTLQLIQLFLRCFKVVGLPVLAIMFLHFVVSSAKSRNLGTRLTRLPKGAIVLLSLLVTTVFVVQMPVVRALVENEPPVADAGLDQTVLLGEKVTFDGGGSYDLDGIIISYEWDFGDPFDQTLGTGVNPTHTYSHSDVYVVTLTVTDDAGDERSDTVTVVVEDRIIMLELHYDRGSLSLLDVYRKFGFAPDRRIQPESGHKAQVVSKSERILYEFTFGVPNVLQYDYPDGDILAGGPVELDETDFTEIIPYFENAAWINLYYPNGTLALSVSVEGIPEMGGSNCQTRVNRGLSSLLFDIVFVAHNYTTAQLSQFLADVDTHRGTLLSVPPFSNHSSSINIHWVNESRNLGCQYINAPGDPPNTPPRLLTCNGPAVLNLASQCPADEIIVLFNSNTYGGGGYRTPTGLSSFAMAYSGVAPSQPSGDRVTVHEFGHSFGGLYDEYNSTMTSNSTAPTGPNCDLQPCTRWASLNLSISCNRGCTYSDWYRGDDGPGDLMRTLANFYFGPVCRNALNGLLSRYPRPSCGGTTPCQCGDVLIQSRTLNTSDFSKGPCGGIGLEIGAPGLVLDCNGRPMIGSLSGDAIISTSDNVTIKNCNVLNFANGIHVLGARNNTILNNTVSSSILLTSSNGIWIETSTSNNVTNNTVSLYYWGIGIDTNANNNLIKNNTVSLGTFGIEIGGSSGNTIEQTRANNNTSHGIYLTSGSSNNRIIDSTADFNNQHGLYISDALSVGNNITNNRFCFNNQTGGSFDIFDADANNGTNNRCNTAFMWNDWGVAAGCTFGCVSRTSTYVNATLGVNATISSSFIATPITILIANVTNAAFIANATAAIAMNRTIGLFANVSLKCPPIDWAYIQIYYNESKLIVDESTLMMYYWNPTILNWTLIPNSGVDTVANYVWGNVTHLSIFTGIGKFPTCEGNLEVKAVKHTVGAGTYPGSTKEPLTDLTVRIYDKSPASCAASYGISWQNYHDIVENCDPIATGLTDSGGIVTFSLPAGDYLVIGSDGSDVYLGVSASDFACDQTMRKYLQLIVTTDGKKVPAKYTRITGSELLIIEPEYIEWIAEQELYPFIFDSMGAWDVEVSVNPPEGFVADHRSLNGEVTNEIEALQFTITDVGSRYVPTNVMYKIKHKGRSQIVRSQIGISLTPQFAKVKGLDIAKLRAQGVHFSRCDCDGTVDERFVDSSKAGIADLVISFISSPIQIQPMLITIALIMSVTISRARWRGLRRSSIRRLVRARISAFKRI